MSRLLPRSLRRFVHDDSASVTVEVVLILPLLLWGYFGLFMLFEGYRSLTTNVNSAYVISDLLSRETNGITSNYIEGLNSIQDVLTQSPHRTVLRVSVVEYDADQDDHELQWSYATAGRSAIQAGQVDDALVPFLPGMYDGEQLIIVETWMAFVPFLDITTLKGTDWGDGNSSYEPFYFEGVAVTRPRFASQLCWVSCASSS